MHIERFHRLHFEVLSHIVSVSGGDMRQGITLLQSSYRLVLCDQEKNVRNHVLNRLCGTAPITKQQINDISGVVPTEIITRLLTAARTSSFDEVWKLCFSFAQVCFSLSKSSRMSWPRATQPGSCLFRYASCFLFSHIDKAAW